MLGSTPTFGTFKISADFLIFHRVFVLWFSPLMIASKMQNIRAKRSVPGSLIPGSPLYKWRS
ncbi:hypothetical protein AG1IA_08106 [Rhizoctonia solani AG-1 IA]|uniref:Uncharacterized protein n=1 Tax=Thanatephorus cucumeris (strain AG1-IA) TaxID=983506 RepID=L8WI45_THACA|nr:hypothetical protein AG1IA_08106 [Rhizoctonia solani AG-1 IA]